ncbi:1-aminocyclopropane-1-carboxylate deaminase/D-cysteine desulfhydrase [Tenacibaculum todarodis]|uniref:1-aminocyclopropane-1-carboxylate deaminase/D-cysteine desulfhydrase n=1 Tax=Tenacibaculum todarodis TaxID=1850252 RepID=UPI000AE566D3|nr:pyridoxal-phosphate dependent enzyme [Tenacibaculum todarodis]
MNIFKEGITTQNQQINLSILEEKGVELFVKREDAIHPFVSGNKFRKLKYNLQEAQKLKKKILLTFGGAFSNHIVATAVAGKKSGFKTIGVIRGEELGLNIKETLKNNATLREAHENGMHFQFVPRDVYRQKTSFGFIEKLKNRWGDFYLIPEGGTNCLAVDGCQEILTEEDSQFNYICSAVGTGGTIAGLVNSAKKNQKILGFPALKAYSLADDIKKYTTRNDNWKLQKKYHFGGYGKYNEELISFINQFKEETSIPLDPVYTGKMLFGVLDLVGKDYFEKGSKILVIHTGGLQGIDGVNAQLKTKNKELILV